jgi:glycosyltransferase involved in cell wall biosynthesis
MKKNTQYSVAIFAHNVSGVINACIRSVLSNSPDNNVTLYILASGCTDSTESIVRSLYAENENVHLVSIAMADKANAWNHYVHELAPEGAVHFFIDGDVEIQLGALARIVGKMAETPVVNAIGGVPLVGRDRAGWVERMISFGRVSGGLYALRGSFLEHLRQNGVKLPTGFIGDDFLISALVKDMSSLQGFHMQSPLLHIERAAGFSFRSLSPMRIKDYPAYFRRLVRYRIRDYQLSMLMHYVKAQSRYALPTSVE